MATLKGGRSGVTAEVDKTFKLQTRSVARTDDVDAGLNEDAFFLATPAITLTSATESAGFIYQNDEDRDLILVASVTSAGFSTGGTSQVFSVSRQAGIGVTMTSGTGTDMSVISTIFGSTGTLANTSEVGQEGASLVGAQASSPLFLTTGQRDLDPLFAIIPKGVTIGISITPPASNTSMTVTFLLEVYLREDV